MIMSKNVSMHMIQHQGTKGEMTTNTMNTSKRTRMISSTSSNSTSILRPIVIETMTMSNNISMIMIYVERGTDVVGG